MDKQKKQQLISYAGMLMTMLGILVVFFYFNLISSLFMYGVMSRDASFFMFKAQTIIKMLGLLLIIIGVISIFNKSDS
ncbi:MAG: hypothetical protein M8352_00400 [ANME-2 cluster archaeon]|nr:hypothetical protein [ANME-2 cluster archaeon]MDF1530768.1 hypothetical protein [ANME-2 cluster archaeon]